VFIEAKDVGTGGDGDNWSYKSCKVTVKSSPPTPITVTEYFVKNEAFLSAPRRLYFHLVYLFVCTFVC